MAEASAFALLLLLLLMVLLPAIDLWCVTGHPGPTPACRLQLPQRGRTRGRGSNSALNQEQAQEGTAWLGCAAVASSCLPACLPARPPARLPLLRSSACAY